MQTIKTSITNRHGLKMVVQIEIPPNPKGLAFVMHGFKGDRKQPHIEALSDSTLSHALTTVSFDCTHSLGESDGDPAHATFTSFTEDLDDLIQWAKSQTWYRHPVILTGHSMAGIAILEYVNNHPDDIDAIAPIAGCISGQLSYEAAERANPDLLSQWQTQGYKDEPSTSKPGIVVRIPWSHMENRFKHDCLPYATSIFVPVFIFAGSEDSSCPPDHQQLFFNALGSQDKELHIIDGLPHTYRTKEDIDILKDRFTKWLSRIVA